MVRRVCHGMCLLLAGVLIISGCAKKDFKGKKPVLAKVNNAEITLEDFNKYIAGLPEAYADLAKEQKKEVLDNMILEEIILQKAKRSGMDQNKEVKELAMEAEKRILVAKLLEQEVDKMVKVTDKDAQDYYELHKSEYNIPMKMRASHILAATQEEADDILAKLKDGGSFEELAKEKSIDSTAKKGGDVGYFSKGDMIPEFEQSCLDMEPGQVSDVVKTKFGYHIIKLTEKNQAGTPEFSEIAGRVKESLIQEKKEEAFAKLLNELKSNAKVEVNNELLDKQ